MKPVLYLFAGTCIALTPVLAGCSASQAADSAARQSPVQRGEYLVTTMGCNDCHTPLAMGPKGPEPDMKRMLSGHPAELQMPAPPVVSPPWMMVSSATNTAFHGPWGTSYATNLTPDETGIGIWSEEMFLAAMKKGEHLGDGRAIQPPMPWPAYGKLTDEDLKAIYAYLKSIPAISNKVPEYAPPAEAATPAP